MGTRWGRVRGCTSSMKRIFSLAHRRSTVKPVDHTRTHTRRLHTNLTLWSRCFATKLTLPEPAVTAEISSLPGIQCLVNLGEGSNDHCQRLWVLQLRYDSRVAELLTHRPGHKIFSRVLPRGGPLLVVPSCLAFLLAGFVTVDLRRKSKVWPSPGPN